VLARAVTSRMGVRSCVPDRSGKWEQMDLSVVASVASVTVIVIEYAVKVIAIGVVPEHRRPSSSSAWLLLILFVPAVGIPAFLMLGSPYIIQRRARIQAEANQLVHEGAGTLADVPPPQRAPREFASVAQLSRAVTALPTVAGNSHGVIADYESNIARIAELVDESREYVH